MTKSTHTLPPIQSSLENNILTLTINRYGKKNALTREMYTLLTTMLDDAQKNIEVRVVVITGDGQNFTAGNDISDFLHNPPKDDSSPVLKFLKSVSVFPKPLIAAVEGVAVGIGTTLLMHCDFVVLAPDALLKLPFVELGLCPEAASSLLLPRQIGYLRASDMILFGSKINGKTAVEWGLGNLVSDNVLATAQEYAQKLANQPPAALVLSKKLLKSEVQPQISERLSLEGAEFVKRLTSPEAIEAFTAFLQKKSPDFSKF